MTTEESTASESSSKIPTPLLATLVAVGALLAGGAAFFATTKLMGGGELSAADLCRQGKEEVLAVKAAAPDPAVLDTNPALSLRLSTAGEKIYNNCIYKDGREFEMQNVENWVIPAPTTTVPSGTPESTTVAPPSSQAPDTSGE